MRRLLALLPFAFALAAPTDGGAADDAAGVAAALAERVTAFNACDANRIAALYAPDAVFWGATSRTLRTTPAEVLADFTESVARRPRLRTAVVEQRIRVLGDTAVSTGAYTSPDPREEEDVVSPARFTFVHRRGAGAG